MLEFSLDQLGSRFIQQKLDTLSPEELEAAFAEIAPKGIMLMNDVFGNYVIQKFLELDVDTHRQELAAQMKGQVGRWRCCWRLLLLLRCYEALLGRARRRVLACGKLCACGCVLAG